MKITIEETELKEIIAEHVGKIIGRALSQEDIHLNMLSSEGFIIQNGKITVIVNFE